ERATTPTFSSNGMYPCSGYCLAYLQGNGTTSAYILEDDVATATPACTEHCNSNVLFLPGIEASRLYATSTDFLDFEHENQLWEPNVNADVDKLALSSSTGESLNPIIYTSDVMDETTFPIVGSNIYKSFLDDMNKLVIQETIRSFKPLPYDWRMDVRDVVRNPIKTRSSHYSMVEEVEKSAHNSRTGKVTIVAHSMGGLVAKALLDELEIRGEADLVDKVIFVATPQLGTPQGVLTMLHGESFGYGYIRASNVREVAENMKSGYELLPSLDYFAALGTDTDPIIEFSTTTSLTLSYREAYGGSISTYSVLRRFLLGQGDGRDEPASNDVNTPNKLKESFMLNAEDWHSMHGSSWTPPDGIQVINVVGWGIPTLRGIRYNEAHGTIDPQPLGLDDTKMIEGDGTVIYPSAKAALGAIYWVNIKAHNIGLRKNREHKDILEISSLRTLLTNIITESDTALPEFVSYTKPTTEAATALNIGVHSPVVLHLYDSVGHHTGPISNPDPESDLDLDEEQIPNSYYWRIGEGQYAGTDMATSTTVTLKGTDVGTFDIDIHTVVGGTSSMTIFSDIPVTASTTATLKVSGNASPSLAVDINSDGTVDATIAPGKGITAEELVSLLRGLADSLNLPAKQDKKLDKKIAKLQKVLNKEYKSEKNEKRKLSNAIDTIISRIIKWEQKGILTNDEAASLIAILEQMQIVKILATNQ
ncbi:hypothetical protein FJY93_00825, partial [Candidatus Kaiserbacteria bacterium]|nr:hypothetical protein [Candidatus Kaiserbacteria bacterium]